ncbi:DeoR/GlpR family DNA-binding transcription regulator [Rhodococcoides kyotonense]|uniref:Lactose phosphotransferase system repressor n=1 Tax=Rhodococcoides kyotonense TaxID=398843 RepID=A0A239D040_9NOCA|nr:DeoR/GlpR family DNA-binding transcription regulator [Rhodococcus kyotonensis]SNS25825.1 DeoR family transcriptional regulator, fructose operon transcriptional repressor [Rhodococcus kyotonensis]
MYAEERQQSIAELVSTRGRISVADLSIAYGVTTETVRRDLAVLDRLGIVRRVHGGAVPASALTATEPGVGEREYTRAEQKDAIASAALDYLPPTGGSAVLDAGTTTGRLAALLGTDRELTLVTNSVPIAARVAPLTGVNLRVLGGRVRGTTQAAVGPEALQALEWLRVDVAFIGTNALSIGHGLSTPDSDEAAVKRAMVTCANHVVVLADSSKIGREHLVSFARLDHIDVLVTDGDIEDTDRKSLTDNGIEVVIA